MVNVIEVAATIFFENEGSTVENKSCCDVKAFDKDIEDKTAGDVAGGRTAFVESAGIAVAEIISNVLNDDTNDMDEEESDVGRISDEAEGKTLRDNVSDEASGTTETVGNAVVVGGVAGKDVEEPRRGGVGVG